MRPFVYDSPAAVPQTIDNDRVTISFPSIYRYNDNEWVINTKIINKLPDMEVAVGVESMVVNGVQCFPRFDERISANDSYDLEIVIDKDEVDSKIIGEYSDIEINLRIYIPKYYFEKEHYHETIRLYPLGIEKVTRYRRKPQPTDVVIVDDEYCTVTVANHRRLMGSFITRLFIENKCDVPMMFTAYDAKINGKEAVVLSDVEVLEGKCGWCDLWWDRDYIEGKVEKIEFNLKSVKELEDSNDKLTVSDNAVTLYP